MFPIEHMVEQGKDYFVYAFPNGYGAQVLRNAVTFGGLQGLWEFRLMYQGELVHDLHGMPFIFGYNLPSEVCELLRKAEEIPMGWIPSEKKTLLRLIDYFRRS